MMRQAVIIAAALGLLCACATGLPQDLDVWYGDGAEDSLEIPTEMPPDTPMDSFDPLPESDAPLDTFDATDTADMADASDPTPEDVETEPGTCTVPDFVTQAMCSSGYKCTFTDVDTSHNPVPFCDLEGTAGYNEACTATATHDTCQAGYLCVGTSTDARCRPFCSTDTQCQSPSPRGANAKCIITLVDSTDTEIVGVTMCSFHCDPLDIYSSGCATGQACKMASTTTPRTTWFTDCREAGTGSGCIAGTDADCPAGQGCFSVSGSNQCLPYCRYPSGTPSCSGSAICSTVTNWPTWIGACL